MSHHRLIRVTHCKNSAENRIGVTNRHQVSIIRRRRVCFGGAGSIIHAAGVRGGGIIRGPERGVTEDEGEAEGYRIAPARRSLLRRCRK